VQIAVPLALLGWQAFGRDTHIVSWGLKAEGPDIIDD
jgi:hypothetical protein